MSRNLKRIKLETYRKMLETGISADEEDENKVTLLYELAISIGYAGIYKDKKREKRLIELMKLLISYGANIDHQIYNGWTALIEVAERGFANSVETLLVLGANANVQDNYGKTALICSAENNHTEVVEILLTYKTNLEIVDNEGQTALMKAASECFFGSIKLLLNSGANKLAKDFNQMNALDLAKQRLHLAHHRKTNSVFPHLYPLDELNRCLNTIDLLACG